ncbi:hypothetical protein [Parvicella tangerina]|uniref:Uncharacterized protein n=1 Tax=Parvicella tangerina TaxID=2829795 RepID=A0A916JK95_9FLAO|nr:hypothetical protein [Parvicella tangerina]CAG5078958.1 hypothetical protein CRYO30217_00818 [Parvicella tangerina]
MSTAELKYSIIELISSINDESKLRKIYQSISSESKDWWDELTEEQKASVERGVEDIKHGRVTPHETVMSEIRQLIESKKTE